MLILYNLLQLFIILLFFPLLLIYIAIKTKYRRQIPKRLGIGLRKKLSTISPENKVVWVHALSVGEVTSALPLVNKLRKESSDITLVFSASTQSGYTLAEKLLASSCDVIIPFPLDVYPAAAYFIKLVQPDLFVLVETDFWPNFLHILQSKKIPAILVNGRISDKSMERYRCFHYFFSPLFTRLSLLCVQSDADRQKFIDIGVPPDKILKLGNLKYEPAPPQNTDAAAHLLEKCNDILFIAGSTHPGEEKIILQSFQKLQHNHAAKLLIAPRNIDRALEILFLAEEAGHTAQLHTDGDPLTKDVYIIDTIGDLTGFYMYCDICFVGGSLVEEGGHNPLEPANFAKPIIFGPFMTDFSEITQDLLHSGGAFTVKDSKELTVLLHELAASPEYRLQIGKAAQSCCHNMHGLLQKHINVIRNHM